VFEYLILFINERLIISWLKNLSGLPTITKRCVFVGYWPWQNWTIGYCRKSSSVEDKNWTKTQLSAIAQSPLRKSVLPYSCYPSWATHIMKKFSEKARLWKVLIDSSRLFWNLIDPKKLLYVPKEKIIQKNRGKTRFWPVFKHRKSQTVY
jgi:hypothetical protein